ncbi:MAG TPA: hypothetical protein DIV41_08035 [Ruminococcaceae bacterium]|nr:hypothetical protein [Oscillospiraceae bacterium]
MKKIPVLIFLVSMVMLSACSGSTGKNADLDSVMEKMKGKITNSEMEDISPGDMTSSYGLKPDDVKQFAAYIDSTGTKGDEIVLVEAGGSEAAERIKTDLDNRYGQKEIEMKDYLPAEYAVLKKCSVERYGNYISMIVSPQYEELEKIYRDSFS